MLLKKIILNNFRQFYGEQTLKISSDLEKNVTLIHAENGVGKTTILNSVLWCFYEKTTERFEQKENIANFEAVSEGKHNYGVTVVFSHNGKDYSVVRKHNNLTNEKEFKVFEINEGNYEEERIDPNAFIESVIPREMSKYFFFDGEYAETFSSQNNRHGVKNALEDMLGCSIANQTIDDLNSVKKEYSKELSSIASNNKLTSQLQSLLDNLEEEKSSLSVRLIECEDNLDVVISAREEIKKQLRGTEEVSSIQKKREDLENQRDSAKEERKIAVYEIAYWVRDYGASLLIKKIEAKASKIFKEAEIEGKIPFDVAENFVQDIIDSQMCICGRPFEKGSKEEDCISDLLNKAGNKTVLKRLTSARFLLNELKKKRKEALKKLKKIQENIQRLDIKISNLESGIDECKSLIDQKGGEVKEIAERTHALDKKVKEFGELSEEKGQLKRKIEDKEEEISKIKYKMKKHLVQDKQATEFNNRISFIESTVELLEKEIEKYKFRARENIESKVNDVLDKVFRRHYMASIDDKFNLDLLYKENGIPVPRSSGENQLLSLAFIASLISFSVDRINDDSEILKPGTQAPLLLDSPFGQLDPTYKVSTADFLPQLAQQVIILVSQSQGDNDILDRFGSNVGSRIALISKNRESANGKSKDIITINGEQIECSRFDQDRNMTEILNLTEV